MRFTLRPSKPKPPQPVSEPEISVERAGSVYQSEPFLPHTKLEMCWTVVDGKLVCEWQQRPD